MVSTNGWWIMTLVSISSRRGSSTFRALCCSEPDFCTSHPRPSHVGTDAGKGLLSQHKQLGLLKKIQGLEKREEARCLSSISSACPTGGTGGRSLTFLFALAKSGNTHIPSSSLSCASPQTRAGHGDLLVQLCLVQNPCHSHCLVSAFPLGEV